MDVWKKFIDELNLTEKLEEIYFRIRLVLQREGWSDKDLERPPYYPQDLMSLYHKFSNENEKLLRTIKEYGFDVDYDNLLSYLQNKLKKIDEITPLKN
jgi:hypothetical protein